MVLLEAKTEARETQSYSPALYRKQALIERADDIRELPILGLEIIMEEALKVSLG